MAVKAKQQYYADNVTLKKEAREFGMIDELKEKLDSVEWGAQVNVIEEVQENGVPLEIVDKTVNVLVPEVIDNLYTIDPNNSLSAKQGKILYDMIKNLLARGRFLSTWNTATGLPLTNPEESPYEYKAGDYYIVGVTAQEGGTNFRPEPVEYVINVASDEQETSEVHVSDIYVYDGENWILLINSTRELAVDDYVDYTYQSTNPVENQAIARELAKKQNIFHYIGNTAPTPQNEGDEWYDTANDKLKVWDGTQWNEVGNGDTYTAGLHISIDPNDNNKISVVEWSATSSALGLVKLGSDTVQSTSPNNVTSTTGRTYRIQANGSGQLMVNVPWTDTTYIAGTGISISNNRVISCTVKPVTVGPTAPSTPGTGDLWYDTNKNTMFLYKNNAWTIIGPEIYPITKADYDALTPAEQGDGRFFLITDNDGTIYVDWENVQNRPMYIGTTAPTNPCEGYLWYDTTNDVLKVYDGTQWNEVGGGGGCCYTAGNGISISNDEISIDTTVVATKTDLNSKQDTLTAGANITIAQDGTISAIDTTYTAGTGIDITNGVISNTQTSAEWGNITGTLSDQTDLQDALDDKQDALVSGTNIKTVNNNSLLGSGNIDIPSGKNDIVTSTTAPSDHTVLWIKDNSGTSGTNELYYYDNKEGKWVKFNGVYEGDTAPEYFNLWYDTNDWTLKVSDARTSNQFSPICLISYGSSSAPGATLWYYRDDDTGDSRLKYYDEDTSEWQDIRGPYINSSAPYDTDFGEMGGLWVDTSGTYPVVKYYDAENSQWKPVGGVEYIAGDGIDINNGSISVDVTDIIGTGLSEDANNNIIVDTTTIQEKLVSGTNIKTVNNNSLLGSGNIDIPSGKNDIVISEYTAPSDDSVIWYDIHPSSDSSYRHFKYYDGYAWTEVERIYYDSSVPTSRNLGDLWYDTNYNVLKYYDYSTSTWKSVGGIVTSAGNGIDITNGEISVDVTDIIGTGLSEDANNNIIVDSTIVALKSDLSNYYTKTETYTKTEVDNLIANVGSFEVVATLPSADTADTKKIYLLGPIGTGADKYEEYIVTESEGVKSWTKIGETSIDLSGYATTTALTNGLATKQDTLVSGTNIKTINNESLLGSGNITISAPTYTAGEGIDITNDEISVDTDVIQEKLTSGTGISIAEGQICEEESDRKGPAPSGFHVPSTTEWQGVRNIIANLGLTTGDSWRINLHMPFAGRRSSFSAGLSSQGSYGFYWFSSPYGSDSPDDAWAISLNSSAVNLNSFTSRASGLSVRCFKNSYEAPDSSWTVINGTLGGAGIFWNQTEGLISITNSVTGYTIQDKNLGATTVYNDGDALTQDNMGNMYQWGNNHGFPSTGTISNTSSTQVDASGYGPGNYYESDTFITGSEDWSSVHNDDLWGDTSNSTHQECTTGGPLTISADTTVLATQTDLSGKQDKATSGSIAPSTTPTYVGQQYIDTTADKMYVATGTTSSSDWTEVGAGSGDMLYSDFGWETLTGASVTLALRGEIEPSANFTVNKPNDLKDGQFYVLRVITGATAYTMTLGTDVTNPYSEDLTLVANNVQQFMFLAKDGELELQPSTEIDISGKQDKATSGSTAPSTTPSYIGQQYVDTTNNILYVAKGTSSSSDWIVAGKTYTSGTNITIDANNVISATDTTYTAGDGIDITNNVISADLVAGTGINLSGGTCVTESDRKGPCPSGFHVPALTEWQGLKTIMTSVSGSGASYWISNLHMPLAGARYSANGGRISYGMRGNYQSSTPYRSLALVSGVVDDSHGNSESEGYSIRAFKNEFVVPDSSWTVVNGTLGNAGIFWDQTNGLISITSDGTTGYTMQDKNLGATVVYNDGDTLTAANCGNLYQWGNNYGFSWDGTLTTSSTKVDASDYGPGNYYSSSTFITTESGDNSWSSVRNDNLWGNTSNSTHQECVYAPITISSTVNGFNPSNAGTEGQVLTKTSTGYNWAAAQGGGGNVIAMTQSEYNALTTEEKNDGKLRIITDAPTEDISVDWANIANKPIELSTQSGNTLTSLKIWVGSQTDYEALATKDTSTLYFTTNVVS